nr:hypothetical protein [Pontibacter akesuensis]
MADLVAALLHEVKHQLEVLALIVLGALVGAAELVHDFIAVALGITAAALQLRLQALVRLGLLLGGDAGVDHGHLSPYGRFAFLLACQLRPGEYA